MDISEKTQANSKCVELRIRKISVNFQQLVFLRDLKLFMNQEIGVSEGVFFALAPLDVSETDYNAQ